VSIGIKKQVTCSGGRHAQERAQVGALADAVQEATGNTVELAWVDHGDTGDEPPEEAEARGSELAVVRLPEATKGVILLPRRGVVARSVAWPRTTSGRRNRWPACIASPVPVSCVTHCCSHSRTSIHALGQPFDEDHEMRPRVLLSDRHDRLVRR
jgi:hypothetical protein